MSAIASFTRIPAAAIEELRTDYDGCMQRYGEPIADYEWSGYVIATLLPYLDERGINLGKSDYDELTMQLCRDRETSIIIFTSAQKEAYLDRLSPAQFSVDELRDYFNEFNATNEAEIGEAMLDGIVCIQKSLSSLDAGYVVVLCIG